MFQQRISPDNNIIRHLSQSISGHLDTKSPSALAQRLRSLGMPLKEGADVESIVRTAAQVVANLLDQILLADQKERENQVQRHSTLQSSPNCLSGKLHLAAMVFSIFCPRLSIWNILDLISSARKQLSHAEVLERVKLKEERVVYPPNLRNNYSCPCLIFNEEPNQPPTQQRTCASCKQEYHGECQLNSLFCNCCFLRFCMFDLKEQMGDPYNHSKEVEMVYFTYMENAFKLPHAQDNDCVFFYVAHFTLPDMNNIKKKDRNFYIKMARSDRIFSGELPVSLRRKRRTDPKQFWDLDGINYYLYLNHNQLKITNQISDSAVIFKLVPRALLASTNILVVKCLKRNMKYAYTQAQIPYLYREEKRREKVVMLGIYQTNKIRSSQLKNKLALQQLSKNIIPEIGATQSASYIEYVLRKINNIDYQLVDLIDVNSKQKIINPVRSYSCTHVQCFDFETFRQKVRPNVYKSKSKTAKKNKEPIDVDQSDNQQEKKVINLDSSEQIPLNKPVSVPRRAMTALQLRKFFMKKKRQRERRQKDCLFCPICSKRMLSLYIDPLFKQILLNSGFYTKARVYSNGEYKFEGGKSTLPT